ncbi:MAG TPA: ATP-binding protein [Prevotella sp.]|nr:ATP-binding protein [Prevotella sp.]
MLWTENIRHTKNFLLVAGVLIAVASLVISHILVKDLEGEEKQKMKVWAEAMRSLSTADENTDLNLVLRVLNGNNTIPVIVMDSGRNVQTFRNVSLRGKTHRDSLRSAKQLGLAWEQAGKSIKVYLDTRSIKKDYMLVCYDDSILIKRLAIYPFIQLSVVIIFLIIAVFALLSYKKAEQNRIWVGLSKETAHQLGTPISSLMAWVEVLKESYPKDELIPEMNKDISRLQLIADRFSKIGSLPELLPVSLNEVLQHVVDYMDRRTSRFVKITIEKPRCNYIVKLNASLFEWVIENLCKNAVDAMGQSQGSIIIRVMELPQKIAIEISDTGKGIRKKDLSNIFRPGFTTKQRGWGLGLSLAKRIVEEYHKGKIFVKSSEVGKGTTFRIELKKY